MPLIEGLSAHGYSLTIAPDHGACLTSLTWRHPDRSNLPLLRTCDPALLSHERQAPVSCFVMVPFANRIDKGVFVCGEREFSLPINRPEEQVAIHGLSRLSPFEIRTKTQDCLSLVQQHRGDVFTYNLEQTLRIEPNGFSVSIEITNLGSAVMPFGIGLHPFFHREEGARLQFKAATRFLSDNRNLPFRPTEASEAPDFSRGVSIDDLLWFDAHYSGWEPREAVLERPNAGLRLTIRANGAFRNLHIFVPDDPCVLCIEPVSHVPNVHNRRDFASFGDVTLLEPGASIRGAMHLSATMASLI